MRWPARTSVSDLRQKLMKYIRAYAQRAWPTRWTYTDPKRRIVAKRITGTDHYDVSERRNGFRPGMTVRHRAACCCVGSGIALLHAGARLTGESNRREQLLPCVGYRACFTEQPSTPTAAGVSGAGRRSSRSRAKQKPAPAHSTLHRQENYNLDRCARKTNGVISSSDYIE